MIFWLFLTKNALFRHFAMFFGTFFRITVKKTLMVYCIEAFAHLFISLSPFYHCSKLKTKEKASLFQLTFFRSKKF